MNINLTVLIQLVNVCLMIFILKKILLDKVLEVLKEKKLAHSLLFQKLSYNRQILAKVNQEPDLLWRKFKEQNTDIILSKITDCSVKSAPIEEHFTNFASGQVDQQLACKTAAKLSSIVISKSKEI